ncbi:MAG: taurine dioxygenase [Rhodospirillales bacterium]|nr:taurine dioxygenase [Rhodospirillales bacterium]
MEVRPLAGALGAQIFGVDLSRPIGDSLFADIYKALLNHLVIFFPEQKPLRPEQHRAFADRFGKVDLEPFAYPFKTPTVESHTEILLNVKEASDTSINVGGFWHADVTYRDKPHKCAVIYAKEAPPYGGDTMFANQYLAYETLSPGMRRMLDGMQAEHDSAMIYGGETARYASVSRTRVPTQEDRKFSASLYDTAKHAETIRTEHPVVRTHPETKRKCLYINRGFATRFSSMTKEESLPLLEFLWQHASRPEFSCRYRWTQDDVGVWDNRCAMHYALNDYSGYRREMHRISVHEESRPG